MTNCYAYVKSSTQKIMSQLAKLIGESAYESMVLDPVLFVRAFDNRKPWPFQAEIMRQVTERAESVVLDVLLRDGKLTTRAHFRQESTSSPWKRRNSPGRVK